MSVRVGLIGDYGRRDRDCKSSEEAPAGKRFEEVTDVRSSSRRRKKLGKAWGRTYGSTPSRERQHSASGFSPLWFSFSPWIRLYYCPNFFFRKKLLPFFVGEEGHAWPSSDTYIYIYIRYSVFLRTLRWMKIFRSIYCYLISNLTLFSRKITNRPAGSNLTDIKMALPRINNWASSC